MRQAMLTRLAALVLSLGALTAGSGKPADAAVIDASRLDAVVLITVTDKQHGTILNVGSGVLLGPDGYILTAKHVVGGLNPDTDILSVKIVDISGDPVPAALKGCDPNNDACIIRIGNGAVRDHHFASFPPLRCERLLQQESVTSTGFPGGGQFDLNTPPGVISGTLTADNFYPATAASLPGTSGGPVFDDDGNVVGIVADGIGAGTQVLIAPLFPLQFFIGSWSPDNCTSKRPDAPLHSVASFDIRANVGVWSVRADQVSATGVALSDDEFRAIFDPDAGGDLADRLDQLTAASISFPTLSVNLHLGQLVGEITMNDVELTDVHRGRIGKVSIGGIALNTDGSDDLRPARGTIADASAQGLDLGRLVRLINQAPSSDLPLLSLCRQITFGKISIEQENGDTLKVDKLTAGGVKARQLVLATSDSAAATPGDTAEPATSLGDFLTNLLYGVSFSSAEAEGISTGSGDLGPPTFSLDHIVLANMASAKFGTIELDGLNANVPDGSLALAGVTFQGADFSSTVRWLRDTQATADPNGGLLDIARRLPLARQITLYQLKLDAPNVLHQGNQGDGDSNHFDIAKLGIGLTYDDHLPSTVSVVVDRFVVPLPDRKAPLASQPQIKSLLDLGLDRLSLSAALQARWDTTAKALIVKDLRLSLDKAGTVDVAAQVTKLDRSVLSGSLETLLDAMIVSRLSSARVRFDNDGLFEKILPRVADSMGANVNDLKTLLPLLATEKIGTFFGDQADAKGTVSTAVEAFVSDPHSIELSLQSKDDDGGVPLNGGHPDAGTVEIAAIANRPDPGRWTDQVIARGVATMNSVVSSVGEITSLLVPPVVTVLTVPKKVDCEVVVSGTTYIARGQPCEMNAATGTISFEGGDNYKVVVDKAADGTATGAIEMKQTDLGSLTPKGACWQNDNTRICAFPPN